MDIIGKIEELMNEKGWTKYKLAKESGIPQTTITSMFSGRVKNPSQESLTKIASALGVPLSFLFGEMQIDPIDKDEESILTEKLLSNLDALTDDEGFFVKEVRDDVFRVFDGELTKINSSHFDSAYRSYLKEKQEDPEYFDEDITEEFKEYYNYRNIKNEVFMDRSVAVKENYLKILEELNLKQGTTITRYVVDLSKEFKSSNSTVKEQELTYGELPIEDLVNKNLTYKGHKLTQEQKEHLDKLIQTAVHMMK